MKKYQVALTIAGSDSSGGAGLQADLKTFSSLSCYGLSAASVLTAQNTQGIQAIHRIPATFVKQQLTSIFNDIRVDAIKTGLLLNREIINTVATMLHSYKTKAIIIDPVMIGKDKRVLLKKSAQQAMIDQLFPLATLVTPNIDEAEHLLKMPISDLDTMQIAAKRISALGAKAVLVKGGHLQSMKKSVDCLYLTKNQQFYWFNAPRIDTPNTHGAGCTLSAAITALMARGYDLISAISTAKKYITQAILFGKSHRLGHGPGPTCHFYKNCQ